MTPKSGRTAGSRRISRPIRWISSSSSGRSKTSTASGSRSGRPSGSKRSDRQSTSSSRTCPRIPRPDRLREEAPGAIRPAPAEPRQAGVLPFLLGRGPLAVLRAARLPRRQRAQHRRLAGGLPALRAVERGPAHEDPRPGSQSPLVRRGRAGAGGPRPGAGRRSHGIRAPGLPPGPIGQRAGGGRRGRHRGVLSGVRVRADRRSGGGRFRAADRRRDRSAASSSPTGS
jgi:translation initiation factor IF-2